MLSKLIYRFVAIAFLALMTQVGYSQNYVDVAQAKVLLNEAIADLQEDIDGPTFNGFLQSQSPSTLANNKIDLQVMKTVRDDIEAQSDVKTVMDEWYEKAESEMTERKTKLILALDKVRNLLS